jgi:hypothetical protein
MGMISHLIPPDEDKPSYKLEGVIESISQLMAQSVADSATPEFKRLLQAVNDNGGRSDNSITKATNALKQAIQSEIRSLKPEIKKLAEVLQSTNKDMLGLQGNLVDALSKVKIPDYSDQLERLERSQPDLSPVIKAVKGIEIPEPDERPLVWEFDIERHRNGLIKSVTAKAVE